MVGQNVIREKKGTRILRRTSVVLFSCVVLVYRSMTGSGRLMERVDLDHGLALVMMGLTWIVILLLLLYLNYMYFFTWQQMKFQIGVLVSLGEGRKKLVGRILRQKSVEYVGCCIVGVGLGWLLFRIFTKVADSGQIGAAWKDTLLVLSLSYLFLLFAQYLSENRKKMRSLFPNKFKTDFLSDWAQIVGRSVSVLILAAGIASALFLKKSDISVTSVWQMYPIAASLGGMFLWIEYGILYFGWNDSRKKGRFLMVSYLRKEWKALCQVAGCIGAVSFLFIFLTDIVLGNISTVNGGELAFGKPYAITFDVAPIDEAKAVSMLKKERVEKYESFFFLTGNIRWDNDYNKEIDLISENDFNRLAGSKKEVDWGEGILISQVRKESVTVMTEADGREWSYIPLGTIDLQVDGKEFEIEEIEEVWQILYNIPDQERRTIVLDEMQFQELSRGKELRFLLTGDKNKTAALIEELKKSDVISNIVTREEQEKEQFGYRKVMICFTALSDIVILFCLFIFVCLRISAEKEEWKKEAGRVKCLGMQSWEYVRNIEKRLRLLFFWPAASGSLYGILFTQAYVADFNPSVIIVLILFWVSGILLIKGYSRSLI